MRLHLGAIPDEFTPDESWRPIREPGPLVMQAFALPIGLAVAFLVGYGWYLLETPTSLHFQQGQSIPFLIGVLLSMPALVVVHELLHAIVHPRLGFSRDSIIGAWPSRMLFYAHYSGPLTRDRFLLVFAMPFLIITVLPLAVAATGVLPPYWKLIAAWFSIWNALFACGDVFGFFLILAQVPRRAILQNQGWRTYWKPMGIGGSIS